jgi:hypothetical protein
VAIEKVLSYINGVPDVEPTTERIFQLACALASHDLYMTVCPHTTLELLPEPKHRLRCRRCHLTLGREELTDGYCPECFDRDGAKRYEFEELAAVQGDVARYRCEECGVIIKSS